LPPFFPAQADSLHLQSQGAVVAKFHKVGRDRPKVWIKRRRKKTLARPFCQKRGKARFRRAVCGLGESAFGVHHEHIAPLWAIGPITLPPARQLRPIVLAGRPGSRAMACRLHPGYARARSRHGLRCEGACFAGPSHHPVHEGLPVQQVKPESEFADLNSDIGCGGEMDEALSDKSEFARVFAEADVPTWPNGFDVDAIAIYMELKEPGC
jgi:hypothetical protein